MSASASLMDRVRSIFSGESLRDRTLTGGAILIVGEVYSNGLRLLSNLIMTRLLYPEAFGIMLVVNLVFAALQMLSDVGIRSAIISREGELDRRFVNVAWTIMIIRGVVLGAIAAALAHPIAVWYGQEQLFGLILLASVAPVISGFASPYPRVAERNVKLVRVTVWEGVSQTAALCITLAWLAIHPTIWALAAHGVFAALIMVVSSFLMFPSRGLRLEWDSPTVMELFHFGKWVVLGTALTFLGRQGDSLIVSRFLDFETLGVFSIAISFAKLVEMLAERFSWSLLFPVYSEMKSNVADAFTRNTTRLRLAIYAICFPIVLFLSLGGRVFIHVLYDDRYAEAGWMLEVLALGMGWYVIAATVNSLPLAYGDSRRHMWLQFYRVASVLVSMVVGGWLYGTVGLIWGIAVGQIVYYPFLRAGTLKYRPGGYLADLAFGLGSVALVALFWSVRGWPMPTG